MSDTKSMLAVLLEQGIDPTTAEKSVVANYKLVDNTTSNGQSKGRFVELTADGIKLLCGDSIPPALEELVQLGVRLRLVEEDNSYTESKKDSVAALLAQVASLG